ncbi:hypothetical protein V2J09_017696 [Rumex salicifolius]
MTSVPLFDKKHCTAMEASGMTSDEIITNLIGMGFELSLAAQAVEVVGPSLHNAVDYILTQSSKQNENPSTSHKVSVLTQNKSSKKRSLSTLRPFGQTRQISIREVLESRSCTEKIGNGDISNITNLEPKVFFQSGIEQIISRQEDVQIGLDFDERASRVLQKHFGFSSLKSFQEEALNAWASHQDCLILSATGSGKSLCFQLPALLTGKVVVVISPLISLMHDQCLKLANYGISACFLGSGQLDKSIEQKAMNGFYQIVYVCPETVLRLMQPLQELAENRGIALFAIDEVHCVSKWGHDFRPAYRRLSILRETFTACKIGFLKFDIPIMALTATATPRVREDILQSLYLSKETKIILTSFFRPNLLFSVKHSTCSSHEKDFCELVELYTKKTAASKRKQGFMWLGYKETSGFCSNSTKCSIFDTSSAPVRNMDDDTFNVNGNISSSGAKDLQALKGKQLSAEYLEDDFDDLQTADDFDDLQTADDFDGNCGEFFGQQASEKLCNSGKSLHPSTKPEEMPKCPHRSSEQGPTIIYTPTRAESELLAGFLSVKGVKAAAYNAKLPKSHLRQVHKEFHANELDVVVATVAFGMGIDKQNVRRIIHYGWPQSLEAYYQEAGRAGRDGKPADCILYANLLRVPTLLPSKRSEEQTIQSYAMLADCFRYGMNTSQCRARILVEYFGEEFSGRRCTVCDTCKNGPPEQQDLKAEARVLLGVIAAYYRSEASYNNYDNEDFLSGEYQKWKPGMKGFIVKTREHCKEFLAKGEVWWRGLARVLEMRGLIKEAEEVRRVQLRCPKVTDKGMEYLECRGGEAFWVCPEADMLLALVPRSVSEWGRGWADPEIRRQRLELRRANRKPRRTKADKEGDKKGFC